LVVDEWQAFTLEHALGLREDGRWAAFEVAVDVGRQNGKGGILEAAELLWMLELGEELVIHSAHEFATSMEAFQRMEALLEEGGLIGQLKGRSGISRSHGSEGFTFRDGRRLRYRTRTKGGGRGFSCGKLVLDEAMILPELAVGALLPTMSAQPNPQVWYTGSAVDQQVHEHGIVFSRLRKRGHVGTDPSLAWFEWSANPVDDEGNALLPEQVEEKTLLDPVLWAQANPGLGIRITEEHVGYEVRSMDPRTFAVERLGIGDWPSTDSVQQTVIDMSAWDALVDEVSRPNDPVCFAFDVSPSRSSACIAAAGLRDDGLAHVEITDHRKGVGWILDRMVELWERHEPLSVVCDKSSPAGSLIQKLEDAGVWIDAINGTDYGRACGILVDTVEQEKVRHLGTGQLRAALRAAKTRPLGDAWAWGRTKSAADITPLVAATLAVFAALRESPSVYERKTTVMV